MVYLVNLTLKDHLEVFLPVLLPTDNSFFCGSHIFLITQSKGEEKDRFCSEGTTCLTLASEPQPFPYLDLSSLWYSEDPVSGNGGDRFLPGAPPPPRPWPAGTRSSGRARLGNVAPEAACPGKSLIAESFLSRPRPPHGPIAVIGFLVTHDCQANVSLNGNALFPPEWLEVECFARTACSQYF